MEMNEDYMNFMLGRTKKTNKDSGKDSGMDNQRGQGQLDKLENSSNNSSTKGGRNDNNDLTATSTIFGTATNATAGSSSRNNRSAFKAYYSTLVQEIMIPDDTLEKLVSSIVNLRERIYYSSKMISNMTLTSLQRVSNTRGIISNDTPQRRFGYRGIVLMNSDIINNEIDNDNDSSNMTTPRSSFSSFRNESNMLSLLSSSSLTVQDIQMTIDRDVLQHELMMRNLRKVLYTMSQGIEALGRRLNVLLSSSSSDVPLSEFDTSTSNMSTTPKGDRNKTMIIDNSSNSNDDDTDDEYYSVSDSDDDDCNINDDDKDNECIILYISWCKELYRKQQLANELFDSCNDTVLVVPIGHETTSNKVNSNEYNVTDARMVSQKCLQRWSRQSRHYSYVFEHISVLNQLQSQFTSSN